MKEKMRELYQKQSLQTLIRFSYSVLLLPMTIFVFYCIYCIYDSNRNYEDIITSTVAASSFNLDFKKDFDYETYLLIVGNKTIEESGLEELLTQAQQIVQELEKLTAAGENLERLRGAKKYLVNLDKYKSRIEENIREGNRYEENIQIWENDIQIVTDLIHETMMQYIYYEISDVQRTHQEYQNLYFKMLTASVLIFLGLTMITLYMSLMISQSISKPLRELQSVTEQVIGGDFEVRAGVQTGSEVRALSNSFNLMIDKINELLRQVKEEQIHLRNAELELLQAQINPHFLYNTLDTIVWLAEAGESGKVVEMVQSLSNFFRISLSRGREIITLEEEMQHVRSYLEIQRFRYQDILDYEIRVEDEVRGCFIPKITIQPLVENALYHGVKNRRGKGKIVIRSVKHNDYFELLVEDNGIGMEQERLDQIRTGMLYRAPAAGNIYGLYNVNERIQLRFGEDYGLSIESVYLQGTCVSIRLPLES